MKTRKPISKLEEEFASQLELVGIVGWEREYKFAAAIGRRWMFDFAWPGRMIAVEIEGGVHSGGRHTRGDGFTKDCEKYNAATRLGWDVYRFPGGQVKTGEALQFTEIVLNGGE